MTIDIDTSAVFTELRKISHLNVQNIADAELRDNYRAGVEDTPEIQKAIMKAVAALRGRLSPHLTETAPNAAVDGEEAYSDSVSFTFGFTTRQSTNKATPLALEMHDYILNQALAEFYAMVSNAELEDKFTKKAIVNLAAIDRLVWFKYKPEIRS